MCGFFGIIYSDTKQSLDEARVRAIENHLRKRGPDFQDAISQQGITFVHSRLAILDLEKRSNQPFFSTCGRYVMVYNGEIYNFKSLRDDLIAAGYRFNTESDTEVVLAAYINYGPTCFRRFEGMFACAVYDFKTRECVLARDPAGIKPLYYTKQADKFLFGSDIRSLFLSGELSPALNRQGLAHYLHFGFCGGEKTLLKDVHCLLPGTWYSSRTERTQRYFDLAPTNRINDADEGLKVFENAFADSVKQSLVSDVDVAVLLSGGIDSALIAAEAAKHHPGIKAYSLGFADASFDETDKAKQIAKTLGLPHQIIKFEENWQEALREYAIDVSDPIADSSILATRLLCREVAKQHKVVLSGDGADELFGGYELYRFEAMKTRYGALFKLLRGPLSLLVGLLPAKQKKNSFLNRLKRLSQPVTDAAVSHVSLRGIWNTFDVSSLLKEDFALSLPEAAIDYLSAYHHLPFEAESQPSALERALYADFSYHLPGDMLVKVDRASMAFGLEVRVPFLNPSLIRMAFSLGDGLKVSRSGGQNKLILRKSFRKIFGRKLAAQKKAGFSVPLNSYFNKFVQSKEWQGFGAAISATGLFVPDWKAVVLKAWQSKRYQMDNGLFALLVLDKWLAEYCVP